jgi:hypothetical protein
MNALVLTFVFTLTRIQREAFAESNFAYHDYGEILDILWSMQTSVSSCARVFDAIQRWPDLLYNTV